MKKTLVDMVTGGLIGPSLHNQAVKSKCNLVSPSIRKWFGQGTAVGPMSHLVKSPSKSPRKLALVLSPRKLPHERSRASDLQGIKRKVTSPENHHVISKRKRTGDSVTDENCPSIRKEPSSPEASGSHSRVLVVINNASPAGQGKSAASRKLFMSTPPKLRNNDKELRFQSPTADLPNYVFNPQPRTPRASSAKKNANDKDKTPNWLTRMRLQKIAEKSHGGDCLPKSPVSSSVTIRNELKPTADGSRSQDPGRMPATPMSSQKTPRQVKQALCMSKSAKKRVCFHLYFNLPF